MVVSHFNLMYLILDLLYCWDNKLMHRVEYRWKADMVRGFGAITEQCIENYTAFSQNEVVNMLVILATNQLVKYDEGKYCITMKGEYEYLKISHQFWIRQELEGYKSQVTDMMRYVEQEDYNG